MAAAKQLGEIVLCVRDMQSMFEFYRDVIGLQPLTEIGPISFLKIADGMPDIHRCWRCSNKISRRRARKCPSQDGIPGKLPCITWHSSFYLADPEGNTVELVAYDPSLKSQATVVDLRNHPHSTK